MALTLAFLQCFDCANRWIEFQDRGASPPCPACASPVTSEPLFISHIRRALEVLEEEHQNDEIDLSHYESRAEYLRQMYLEAVPVILKRLGQILVHAASDLEKGAMDEEVISRILLANFGFLELGMPLAAVCCSGMLAFALATRNYDAKYTSDQDDVQWLSRLLDGPLVGRNLLNFQVLLRLGDLLRAIEWARFLDQPRWEAVFLVQGGVGTLRDAARLSEREATPLLTLAYYLLRSAIAVSRRNKYFYVLPSLEHHLHAAARALQVTPRATGRDEIEMKGEMLYERLQREWLDPARADITRKMSARRSPEVLTRLSYLGPDLLPQDAREDVRESVQPLASLLEGIDRDYLQRVLSGGRIDLEFFNVHLEKFRLAFMQYFSEYGEWIKKAQNPRALVHASVHGVMIYGFKVPGGPDLATGSLSPVPTRVS